MTRQEFDEYLKSIGGLESGYKKDHIIDNSHFFEFREGWLQITKDLIEDIIKLGWDKVIFQAKEKFGTGRFYIAGATDPVWNRIEQWERETASTCEVCGSKENVELRGRSWLETLCQECQDKKQGL